MTDPTGQSPADHEGTDEAKLWTESVTLKQLAEAIRDVEQRLRREHAQKRADFESRLDQKYGELWAKKMKEIALLVNPLVRLDEVTPEEIAP